MTGWTTLGFKRIPSRARAAESTEDGMRTTTLGSQGPRVGVIGLGCMGMTFSYDMETPRDDATSISVIHQALDLGMTLIDTADVYGPYTNEELVGRALAGGHRERAVLATKVGLVTDSVERGRPRQLARCRAATAARSTCGASIDDSLRRLGTDHVDLYQLHRVDPRGADRGDLGRDGRDGGGGQGAAHRPVRGDGRGDQAGAGGAPGDVGAVGAVAVDPGRAGRGAAVLRGAGHRLPAVLAARAGFPHRPVRLVRRPARSDDFRRGLPRFQQDALRANLAIVAGSARSPSRAGATPAQVALAWVLAQGEHVVPIPGTKTPKYLADNAGAADVVLSAADLADLDALPAPQGTRY